MFTDGYDRTLDDKHRIQIPAPFRSAIDPATDGTAFYVTLGERENTLSLYTEGYFNRKARSMAIENVADRAGREFAQLFFYFSSRVELDKQGRILLPEKQLNLLKLPRPDSELYLAGAMYRIDIWRKPDYEKFVEANMDSFRGEMHRFLSLGSGLPRETVAQSRPPE